MKCLIILVALTLGLSACVKTAKEQRREMRDYRKIRTLDAAIVNAEGEKCLMKGGIFKVNKAFGLDQLPIITGWSCEYKPELIGIP